MDLARQMSATSVFRSARAVAVYLANDGEINPAGLVQRALQLNKQIYLPVLKQGRACMEFALYRPGDKLKINQYGIPEPLPRAQRIPAAQLDLVCMPLVGFDSCGNRLGMGGGFYDRTFAYKRSQPAARPILAGLAHECQHLERLPEQVWDVPLDMVVTNVNRKRFRRGFGGF